MEKTQPKRSQEWGESAACRGKNIEKEMENR